jgi:16S rRNA (guanine966-N2)-methyltransferase
LKNSRRAAARAGKRGGGQAGNGQMRIIGGQWRGRKLPIVTAQGLRPTGDRIRETLFNWLAPDLPGARCLDLFAGSGALGLEALSRGAHEVTLVELNPEAAQQLRDNLAMLGRNNPQDLQARVIQADSLQWLETQPPTPYDVLFIDPPFGADLWSTSIDALEQTGWLSHQAAIYLESPADTLITVPKDWDLHREKRAGEVCYRLYYRQV